jgi:hypothetical protein
MSVDSVSSSTSAANIQRLQQSVAAGADTDGDEATESAAQKAAETTAPEAPSSNPNVGQLVDIKA